jgi:glycosyltransferase involved in cell wall biosynthesis
MSSRVSPNAKQPHPLISIIVPVFNGMPYIKQCLESIVSQDAGGDIELIVVDSMSSDGTEEVVQSFGAAISHYIREKDNGQLDAIRKGLAIAAGRLVAYQCADDFYLPGALNRVRSVLADNPDVDLIYGDLLVVDEDGVAVRLVRHVDASLEALRYSAFHTTSQVTFWSHKVNQNVVQLLPSIDLRLGMERFIVTIVLHHSDSFTRVRHGLGAFRLHAGSKTVQAAADRPTRELEHQMMNRVLSDLGMIPRFNPFKFCLLHIKKLLQLALEGHWSELRYLFQNVVKIPRLMVYELRGWMKNATSRAI